MELGRERRQTRKYLLIGLAIGALSGAVAGDVCFNDGAGGDLPSRPFTSNEQTTAVISIGAFYAGLGALIGHSRKTVEWSDLPKPDVPPSRGGATWQVSPLLDGKAKGGGLRLRVAW